MTTHYPGPWRHCPKTGQIVDADNRQIARVWQTRDRERDHANGELIAQAPALAANYEVACEDLAHLAGEYSALEQEFTIANENIEHLHDALNAEVRARLAVEAALALCVRAIDELLPGMRHIPCDVGLINTALTTARPLLEDA